MVNITQVIRISLHYHYHYLLTEYYVMTIYVILQSGLKSLRLNAEDATKTFLCHTAPQAEAAGGNGPVVVIPCPSTIRNRARFALHAPRALVLPGARNNFRSVTPAGDVRARFGCSIRV